MKTIALALVLMLTFFSCTKKNESKIDSELIGVWKLTEVLADPGDGSGTYHAVDTDKTIEFHADGTLTSNSAICNMAVDPSKPSYGTYSLADSTIRSTNCQDSGFKIWFRKVGSNLILNYPCIEPCGEKYVKK